MLRLLQLLLIGHVHKWKIIGDVPYERHDDTGFVEARGRRYILQCEHCGKIHRSDP